MAKKPKPKLKLTCDDNGVPIAGECSQCGTPMERGHPRGVTAPGNKKWFEDHFRLHVQPKHAREDFSQAAVRIVREATERR